MLGSVTDFQFDHIQTKAALSNLSLPRFQVASTALTSNGNAQVGVYDVLAVNASRRTNTADVDVSD